MNFDAVLYQPIFNLLIVFYRLFGNNLGFAIIAVGLFFRLILFPITLKQINNAEKSRELMEKTKAIKDKHKNNKEKQQEEIMKLNSEYLPGQLAGCLPLIVQIVLFLQIFRVISEITSGGVDKFNQIAYSFVPTLGVNELNTNFFGLFDLHLTASSVAGTSGFFSLEIIPYLVLIILVGLTQYLSTKVLSGMKIQQNKEESKKEVKKSETPEDFGEIVQQSTEQAMLLMPIMFAFGAYSFPAGLSLYWTVQSGFVIIQQLIVHQIRLKLNKKQI